MKTLSQILFWFGIISIPLSWLAWFIAPEIGREVLEGIVKHETEYDVSDASAYNPELRGQLEAQLANVADELAYTAHDLRSCLSPTL